MIRTIHLAQKLTPVQNKVLADCAKILEEAFAMKMYSLTVNADKRDPTRPFGVAFAFDMRSKDSQEVISDDF